MSFPVLFGVLALLTIFGYFLGRSRALATAGGHVRNLHSLPNYYGYYIGLWCAVPGFLLLLAWMGFETSILDGMLVASLPADKQNLPAAELSLLINDVKNLSHGDVTSREVTTIAAAQLTRNPATPPGAADASNASWAQPTCGGTGCASNSKQAGWPAQRRPDEGSELR